MLECRLTEMFDAVDWFILVEADVDHQNHPKPCHYRENRERFARWASKIIDVQATGLPNTDHHLNPWAREHGQREWTRIGLGHVPNLQPTDIVFHGDVDEICRPLETRNVRPRPGQVVAFDQRLHCFAADWLHPDPWRGTVAATIDTITRIDAWIRNNGIECGPFSMLRDLRNGVYNPATLPPVTYTVLPQAGWHLSWMGGRDAQLAKLGSFCHPEIADRTLVGLQADRFNREGFHVDGRRMEPVDVTDDWPVYVTKQRCPSSWLRVR